MDEGNPVEDPILERYDEQVRAEEELERAAGVAITRGDTRDEQTEAPYDLEPEAPRALALPVLLSMAGLTVPPELLATLGDYRAIVLLHGVTPFHRKAARPHEVWGLGYQATLPEVPDARTVAYEPGNRALKVAALDPSITLDLAADGTLDIGHRAVDGGGTPTQLAAGIHARASARQGFVLSLHLEWSALEVQAGPVGAGGVRWNLYRQANRLDRHHRLVQTALIPSALRRLKVEVTTWVRRRGWFFGRLGAREWSSLPRPFDVPVELGAHGDR